jgi:glycosyltransferase involved in cell wall biosynthesis
MSTRPRVLILSDGIDWVANFAEGYRKMGYDVTGGLINFELESSQYDIVHVFWPEEFCGWSLPTEKQVDSVLRRLDRWVKHARLIFSVSNLYPHRYPGHPLFHRLYTGFYQRADVIHHYAQASKELVCREYPSIASRNHVVHVGFNYERLLPSGPRNRTAARTALGIDPGAMVYLVFGSLRFWHEVRMLQRAFALARVPNKRLLLTADYVEGGPRWRQRWRRFQWRRWQGTRGIQAMVRHVPNDDLPRLFDAADAVAVIRRDCMTSGVPNLAMTFGRYVIAPNFGATAEYLAETGNALYEQDSAEDLARAMERAAAVDRERIGVENAKIAAGWEWAGIVQTCLDALSKARVPAA